MPPRLLLCSLLAPALFAADAAPERSSKDALQAFHHLIGTWKGTGTGPERGRGFWTETIGWRWRFKGDDAWLVADIDKGKHFTRFELRHRPETDDFSLAATTPDKQTLAYTGTLDGKRLTVDRLDPATKQTHRLVFSLLHANRHLYAAEMRAEGRTAFVKEYQVGATKRGVPFAAGETGPECVVSGGLGTMTVTHLGKTYHVCCSGCRDAFKEDPAKYVREFEARKKK